MSDFFPAKNYPGIFATHQWVDAWEKAWSDNENIIRLRPHENVNDCRDGFYTHQHFTPFGLKFTTLFSSGVSTPASPSLRSEYFNLNDRAIEPFIDAAASYKWDQLYIPDLISSSLEYLEICRRAQAKQFKVVIRDESISYAVSLREANFEHYLQGRSGNTRAKLFNKRKSLLKAGEIRITNLWPNVEVFIETLNTFHLSRWCKPCYEGRNLKQIIYFLNEIARAGGVPDLSVIYCDNQPISAVLDVEYRGRIYNIQSGYREDFLRGVSLGTLHLGFQLEKAFMSGCDFYDFMAGKGKSSDYKKSLATHSELLISIMLVRSSLLKGLYAIKDVINRVNDKNNH